MHFGPPNTHHRNWPLFSFIFIPTTFMPSVVHAYRSLSPQHRVSYFHKQFSSIPSFYFRSVVTLGDSPCIFSEHYRDYFCNGTNTPILNELPYPTLPLTYFIFYFSNCLRPFLLFLLVPSFPSLCLSATLRCF